ncbi:zinc ribbon domain-containing protein [Dactylosporangium salmoneum]|uniref:Putative regulatory protein FmdB zinc ribbon domain-containing protein n=1 Tax=Dactylosporangium salmoneum TaxID=53361 RepID=A0ABN3H9A5_9ACTN
MATYGYRCPRDGDFDVSFPIGDAAARVPCRVCGGEAVRVYTAPLLGRGPGPLAAHIERSERSAEEPEVVSGPPVRHRPRRPVHPATARLPKP